MWISPSPAHSSRDSFVVLPGLRSPDVVVEPLRTKNGIVRVVRDDRLPGGTKQRAIVPYLEELVAEGYREFVYASPFCGYAQVALASAAALLGVKATIFCETDQTPGVPPGLHPFAKRAESLGAVVMRVPDLATATDRAGSHAARVGSALELPLGFDCDRFRRHLGREIRSQLARVFAPGSSAPRSIWLPLGSGTLATVFDGVVAPEIELRCVNVRIFTLDSPRLARFAGRARVKIFEAPERFVELAGIPPEIPSNVHYDAKLWRFIDRYAEDGDVWWNVGP
jgi:hypothetical protein